MSSKIPVAIPIEKPTAIPIATNVTSISSTQFVQSNPTSFQTSIDIEDTLDTNNTVVNINVNQTLKKVYYSLIILIFELPILIVYCYFTANDNSCSYKYADGIGLSIHSYLIISDITLSFLILITLIFIYETDIKTIEDRNICFIQIFSVSVFFIIIMFIFSVVAGFIFFNSNVNSYCSFTFRNFMNAVLSTFYTLGTFCLCLCILAYIKRL